MRNRHPILSQGLTKPGTEKPHMLRESEHAGGMLHKASSVAGGLTITYNQKQHWALFKLVPVASEGPNVLPHNPGASASMSRVPFAFCWVIVSV